MASGWRGSPGGRLNKCSKPLLLSWWLELDYTNGDEEKENWIYLTYTLEGASTGLANGLVV